MRTLAGLRSALAPGVLALVAASAAMAGQALTGPRSGPRVVPSSPGAAATVPQRAPSAAGDPGANSSPTITTSSPDGLAAVGGPQRVLAGGIALVNGTRVDMGILDAGWADISGRGFGDTPGVVSVLRPYARYTSSGINLPPDALLVLEVMSWSDDHIRVRMPYPTPDSLRQLAVRKPGLADTIPNLVLDVAAPRPDGDVHYQTSPFSIGFLRPINLNGANSPP